MDVILTRVIVITGKADGRQWCKLDYLLPSGETGQAFIPAPSVTPDVDLSEGLLRDKTTHRLLVEPGFKGLRVVGIEE